MRLDDELTGVFDSLPQAIARFDVALVCTYANPRLAGYLGREQSELVGMSLDRMLSRETAELFRPLLQEAVGGGKGCRCREISLNGLSRRRLRLDLFPSPDASCLAIAHDLEEPDRRRRDHDRLVHELDHRTQNILQVMQSVLALEGRGAGEETRETLDAIKARVDALAIAYEYLRQPEPPGGWPVEEVLSRVTAAVGPGDKARALSYGGLRMPPRILDAFIFIASEFARWVSSDGGAIVLEARKHPHGLELRAEGNQSGDATRRAGAAGLALVDSFAQSCGAGPLRGGKRPSIIFPLDD